VCVASIATRTLRFERRIEPNHVNKSADFQSRPANSAKFDRSCDHPACGWSILFRNHVADDNDHLRTALREADWEAMLPNLITYAAARLRRVGWASGRDSEASKLSVEQLVNAAVESCLEGKRVWDPTAVDLPGFLRGVIRSLTSSEKKKAVRAKTDAFPDFDRQAPIVESPEDEAVAEEGRTALLGGIEACTADDPDLQALYRAVVDGTTKREDLAAVLGWSPDRVTAARIKLQRRLVRSMPETFAPARDKRRRTS
jgi:hypothetical protein